MITGVTNPCKVLCARLDILGVCVEYWNVYCGLEVYYCENEVQANHKSKHLFESLLREMESRLTYHAECTERNRQIHNQRFVSVFDLHYNFETRLLSWRANYTKLNKAKSEIVCYDRSEIVQSESFDRMFGRYSQ